MIITGPGIKLYQAIVLRKGIELYAKTGLRPNTAWTPKNMLNAASAITGKTYKRGQYAQAIADLTTWIEANHE
jgi:hypothetical protein